LALFLGHNTNQIVVTTFINPKRNHKGMDRKKFERVAQAITRVCGALLVPEIIACSILLYKIVHTNKQLNNPRATEYVSNLIVNTSKSYKTVVSESELDGIQQIRGLISESPLEESWIYLPKESLWIEIGQDEYIKKNQKGVFQHPRTVTDIMKGNDELIFYHFHPQDSRHTNQSYLALPSKADLESLLSNIKEYSELNPAGKLAEKICSVYGVIEIRLSPEGIDFFSEGNHTITDSVDYRILCINGKTIERVNYSVSDNKAISLLKNQRFDVKFIPYADLPGN
jgi:hypothetical protein